MTADWTLEEGHFGPRMVMMASWSPEALSAARAAGVRELELNYAKGWCGRDVSFLEELRGTLAWLKIIHFNLDNVTPVNALRQLRYLDVNTYCRTEIDFSRFPMLEECCLEWRPKARSLFAHAGIKRLWVNHCPERDLKNLVGMKSLESLRLASSRLVKLEGIEALRKLTFLGVYSARGLTTIRGVDQLPDLVHLEVNGCRKLEDISPVGGARRLRTLHLCNDGPIQSLAPLRALRELEVFLFYESTNIIDGDLSVLLQLPNLRDTAFQERRHYSHRRVDLPSLSQRVPTNR